MEEEMGQTQKQVMVHFIFIYRNWRTLGPYDATRTNSNFYKSEQKQRLSLISSLSLQEAKIGPGPEHLKNCISCC